MYQTIKTALVCMTLSTGLIAMPSYADTEQTQNHLKALLGELMQLEQRLDARPTNIPSIAPGSKYKIKPGDSLDKISKLAYGDTNIRLSLVKQIIVDTNPNAFFRNNANFIYAGKVITIPSVDDFRDMLFSGNGEDLFKTGSDKSQWIRFP